MLKVRIGSEYMQTVVSPSTELSELSYCVLVTAAEKGEAFSDAYYNPTLSLHNFDSSEI